MRSVSVLSASAPPTPSTTTSPRSTLLSERMPASKTNSAGPGIVMPSIAVSSRVDGPAGTAIRITPSESKPTASAARFSVSKKPLPPGPAARWLTQKLMTFWTSAGVQSMCRPTFSPSRDSPAEKVRPPVVSTWPPYIRSAVPPATEKPATSVPPPCVVVAGVTVSALLPVPVMAGTLMLARVPAKVIVYGPPAPPAENRLPAPTVPNARSAGPTSRPVAPIGIGTVCRPLKLSLKVSPATPPAKVSVWTSFATPELPFTWAVWIRLIVWPASCTETLVSALIICARVRFSGCPR